MIDATERNKDQTWGLLAEAANLVKDYLFSLKKDSQEEKIIEEALKFYATRTNEVDSDDYFCLLDSDEYFCLLNSEQIIVLFLSLTKIFKIKKEIFKHTGTEISYFRTIFLLKEAIISLWIETVDKTDNKILKDFILAMKKNNLDKFKEIDTEDLQKCEEKHFSFVIIDADANLE